MGATAGPAVSYTWAPPSALPELLPWLAILGLLALRPNRLARAWWIWAPLAVVALLALAATTLLDNVSSEISGWLGRAYTSLAFGVAAIWLLAPHLYDSRRFVGFLKALLAGLIMTAFALLVRVDQEEGFEWFAFLIFAGVSVLVTVAALCLAGWAARHRYRPLMLTLWLAVFETGLWLLASTPFIVLAALGPGLEFWLPFLMAVLCLAACSFAVVLAFLILAGANGWYRERLQLLLQLEGPMPPLPDMAVPATPANPPLERTSA